MKWTAPASILFSLLLNVLAQAQTPLLEKGRAALDRNDPEAAVSLFKQAVAQSPQNADAHYLLGSAYGAQAMQASMFKKPGLASSAHDEFQRAVELNPNHLEARMSLVQFYAIAPSLLGGDEKKALQEAAEIRKRDLLMGHVAMAFIDVQGNQKQAALKEYIDAVKEQPASAKAHYYLGTGHLIVDQQYPVAAAEFENALRLDPGYMPAAFQIGHLAALRGVDLPRGEQLLQKYLGYKPAEDEPPLYRAVYWIGVIREKEGKKGEARDFYSRSLKARGDQPDVREAMVRVR